MVGDITTNWFTPFRKRSIIVTCRKSKEAEIQYFEADLISQSLNEYINIDGNSHSTRNCFIQRSDALNDELEAFINYLKTDDRGSLASIEDSLITLEIASK